MKRREARAERRAPATSEERPLGGLAGSVRDTAPEFVDLLKMAGGSAHIEFNASLFLRTAQTAHVFSGDNIDPAAERSACQTATLLAMKAFKPANPVEGMLAAQAVMLHNLAMEAGRRAQLPQQPSEIASKLRKDAANSARAMVDVCEALDRRRGHGSQQRIVVERIQVAQGGQAVVGAVAAGALSTGGPEPLQALGAVPCMPVEAGVGEEP